jgi:hypothetical protein
MSTIELPLDKIRLDGGTQSRAQIDWVTVQEYADAMRAGATFPPIVVFFDGQTYWNADGFHRVHATQAAGFPAILAEIHQGTQRDAVLYSVGANANHGLRRTQEDKRNAVKRLFSDDDWRKWSDNEIARRCGVSVPFVGKLRKELSQQNPDLFTGERKYTRNGQELSMKTGNIGNKESTINVNSEIECLDYSRPAGWREGWGAVTYSADGVMPWCCKHDSLPIGIRGLTCFGEWAWSVTLSNSCVSLSSSTLEEAAIEAEIRYLSMKAEEKSQKQASILENKAKHSATESSEDSEYKKPEIERLDLLTRITELEEQNIELRQQLEQIQATLIQACKDDLSEFFTRWSEAVQGKETQPRWVNVARLLKEFEQLLLAE